jgi:hypothetical protein
MLAIAIMRQKSPYTGEVNCGSACDPVQFANYLIEQPFQTSFCAWSRVEKYESRIPQLKLLRQLNEISQLLGDV